MNVYILKERYQNANPDGHFFDEKTLKFFGEALSRMNVLKQTAKITDYSGDVHECYILSKLGKDFLGHKRRSYAYFDTNTFKEVLPTRD